MNTLSSSGLKPGNRPQVGRLSNFKRGMLASAATALVAGALLAAPSTALAQQQDPLRIISFNTWGKSTVSPESLALFGNGDYDIITIQEYRTSYGEDLRDKLGAGGFGTYWLQDSGDKGIASRLPGTAGVGDRGNPYVIIEASGSRPATIVSTEHLNYWDDPFDQRVGQAKQLNGWAKGQTAPILITGDFNAGDVSERGLLEVSQQELLLQKARETQNADYKAWALQYVARNHAIGSAQYNAAAAYINRTSSTKPTGLFSSETYPVEGNTPYTLNILKKDYQLLQNPEDREPFMPHGEADGSTTWPSVKEDDEAFKWPSWGRTQIDHFFASRPYAKWWQLADAQGDPYTGGVLDQSVSTTPGGVALSDHEPIAHDILWYGPQVETRADGSVALTFNDQVLGLKADQEFQLSRNNNRTDVYLGQISDDDGRPIFRRPVEVSDDYLAKLVAEAVYDRYSADQLNALQAQLKAFVPADQYEAYQAELTRLAAKTGNDGYFRSVIKTYFDAHRSEFPGISNISQMSWEQWGRILINDVRANVEFQTLPIVPEWDDLRQALNLDDPAARALLSQKTGLDFENDPDAPLKLRLDCKNLTLLGLQGARDLCVDNHERFKDLLVRDGLTIAIDESAALGSSDGTLTLNNGGLRTAGADEAWAAWTAPVAAINKKIALQGQGGWIDISNPDVPVAALQEISGDGLLEKRGEGTLELAAVNGYTGGTVVQSGVLRSTIAGGFVNGTAYTIYGGTLDLNGFDLAMSSLSGTGGKVALGAAQLTVDQTADTRFDGGIGGAGGLTKAGSGTLVLNGLANYGGDTTVNGGVLQFGNGSAGSASELAGKMTVAVGGLSIQTPATLKLAKDASFADNTSLSIRAAADSPSLQANALMLGQGVAFNLSGISSVSEQGKVLIDTVSGINGDFGSVTVGGYSGATDYLTVNTRKSDDGMQYLASYGLSWTANNNLAHGTFTLTNATDTFEVGADLSDQAANAVAGWDGKSLTKTGAGTLILSGTNSYTGNTSVQAGTLVGHARSIAGNASIDAAAKLVFNQTTNADFAGVLSGSGALGKDGGAALRLTGDSSGFAGTTTVSNGTLLVGDAEGQGKLGGSALVANGGVLGGGGTIGSGAGSTVTVASGGTIAPGNSIGTLTVAGDLTFKTGSAYAVEVNAAGQTDRIAATGAVTIEGGTVNVLAGSGTYAQNTLYTILTAAGGRSGAFASVTSNLAFLAASLNYDANSVFLKLQRNGLDFASVAGTPNQGATGDGVESLGTGNAVYDAVVQLDAAGARTAFDQLSGEIHAGAKTALVEDSDVVRDAMAARLRASFDTAGSSALPVMAYGEATHGMATAVGADYAGAAFWSQGFGSWGSSDGSGGSADLDRRSGGLLAGVDSTAGDWRIGVMAGYSQTSFDADDRSSSGSSDNYHLGVYGGRQFGNLGLRSGASYSWHRVETSRSVAFPGFGDSLTADYDAGTFQAFGELGYGFETQAARFEPFANLAYVNLDSDGFDEDGGAAALSSDGGATDTTFTTLGLRASAGFNLGSVDATARAMLGWRHAFGDTTPESVQAFSGGDAFSIAGAPIAENAAVIEAGVDFNFSPTATLGVSYSGQLASDAQDHGFKADLKIRF